MSYKRKSDIIVKIHRRKEVSEMANRILVVDDEAEIADLIEAYLTGENYTVFSLTLPFWM